MKQEIWASLGRGACWGVLCSAVPVAAQPVEAETRARVAATPEPPIAEAPVAAAPAAPTTRVFDLGVLDVVGLREPAAAQLTRQSIDAATIDALHREDLGEALDLLPGVSLQNLGRRRETLVSVRGFSSRQVPLLIDGVPVYVPYDGNVDLSRFGVEYVSEIMVSKGLASVLYGPNTLGGAINIVSAKPEDPLEARFETTQAFADDATHLEQRYVGGLGERLGRWYANMNVSFSDDDGFELPDSFNPVPAEDGNLRNNADSQDLVISAKLGYETEGGDEYALSVYSQDGEKNVPPYAGDAPGVRARYWQWPEWDKRSVYFIAKNGITEQGTLRWRVYYDDFYNVLNSYDDENYDSFTRPYAFQDSVYDDYTIGGNTDFEWRWNTDHITRTALHYKQDIHRETSGSDTPTQRFEDRIYSVALEHEWQVRENITLTPGYAYSAQDGLQADNLVGDRIVGFATERTDAHNAQLTALWEATADQSVLAGISRKTRFPTLKDRFSFRMGRAIPNAALGPETALHYEIAWRIDKPRWNLRGALFQSDIDDAIENVVIGPTRCAAPNPNCFQQRNIGDQRHRGAELNFDWRPSAAWLVHAQGTYLDRDNRSNPDIVLTGAPEQTYRLRVDWMPLDRWTLRGDARYESERFSETDGSRRADDFAVVNAFLRYTPTDRLGLELGARNLFDELYAYEEGFFEAGRSFLVSLEYAY